MWAPETRSESWRSPITTSQSGMSFASIRAIAMKCRGCLRFRSCPRVGEDGQSIWLDGSPNPIRDATAAESAAAHSKGDGHASRSDPERLSTLSDGVFAVLIIGAGIVLAVGWGNGDRHSADRPPPAATLLR